MFELPAVVVVVSIVHCCASTAAAINAITASENIIIIKYWRGTLLELQFL